MHVFVPRMVRRRQGSILVMASDAGLFSMPGLCAYQTSKYGVLALGETLRMELYEHNIKVSIVCPGMINTNIIDKGRVHLLDSDGKSAKPYFQKFYKEKGADPSIVARASLRALEKDRGMTIVPRSQVGPQYLLYRISPALYFGIFRFLWKKGFLHKLFGVK